MLSTYEKLGKEVKDLFEEHYSKQPVVYYSLEYYPFRLLRI